MSPCSAKISLRAGLLKQKESILIQLVRVENIVPRNSKKDVNASFTISIMPLTKEPYVLRQRTPIFHKVKNTATVSVWGNFILVK